MLDALAAARASGVKVIFVKVGFRDGYPEIGEETRVLFRGKGGRAGSAAHRRGLLEEFVPQDGEPVIDKQAPRFSAFAGSGLELVLRAHDIRDLVLAGVSTGGVVLSTLRQAFDMAYRMTVLSDGCFDPDAEVHDVLMRKIFPRQAKVVSGYRVGGWPGIERMTWSTVRLQAGSPRPGRGSARASWSPRDPARGTADGVLFTHWRVLAERQG